MTGWPICQNLAFIIVAIQPIIGYRCSGPFNIIGCGIIRRTIIEFFKSYTANDSGDVLAKNAFWCADRGLAKKLHIILV